MKKLLLLANPSASSFTGAALRDVTNSLAATYDVEQAWPESPDASRMMAAKAAASSVDVVAAMGGDGVVHHVANGLVGTTTALAVIPAGTTNVIARLLGLPKKARKAAALMAQLPVRSIPVARVTVDGAEPFHAVFSVGMGYDAAVLARAEKRPHSKVSWGPLHYARSALAELGSHATPTIRVGAHDRRADGSGVSIQIQDRYTFLGPLSFAFGSDAPNGFNALVMGHVGPTSVATLTAMAAGRLDRSTRSATVWTDVTHLTCVAEPEAPLQADGESYGLASHVNIEASDLELSVLAP